MPRVHEDVLTNELFSLAVLQNSSQRRVGNHPYRCIQNHIFAKVIKIYCTLIKRSLIESEE